MRDPLSFDIVNYATPIPRNAATLTALGLIFDKVIFPGVYLPRTGYDKQEYRKELERLRSLNLRDWDTAVLLGVFSFLEHAEVLEGFCEFTGAEKDVFGPEGIPDALLQAVELSTFGPRAPNFIPIISSGYTKAVSRDAWVSYPGELHYRAAAIIEAGRRGIPMLNDDRSAAVASVSSDGPPAVSQLATMLAANAASLVLPGIRIMHPSEIMEFREKHHSEMRAFRASMLRHAAILQAKTEGADARNLQRVTEDYVAGTIAPDLEALRSIASGARKPSERAKDVATFAATVGSGFFAGGVGGAVLAGLANLPGILAAEVGAAVDTRSAQRGNGLYYLLQIERQK